MANVDLKKTFFRWKTRVCAWHYRDKVCCNLVPNLLCAVYEGRTGSVEGHGAFIIERRFHKRDVLNPGFWFTYIKKLSFVGLAINSAKNKILATKSLNIH